MEAQTQSADDDALLAAAGRGDARAFGRLVERHGPRLVGLCARMTGTRAVAEEIVQEALTRAWTHAPRWRPPAPGRSGGAAAWLSRIAVNLSLDHLRRPRHAALEAAPEPVDPHAGAEAGLIAAERAARLHAAVARLPERQRAALSLTYDAGLSNAAGAAALDTSVGAFELLLVRARRTLRTELAEALSP